MLGLVGGSAEAVVDGFAEAGFGNVFGEDDVDGQRIKCAEACKEIPRCFLGVT